MSRYRFIHEEKATYAVTLLCRVVGVARSAYHTWAGGEVSARAQAEAALTAQIAAVHERSRRTYGAPRIRAGCQYKAAAYQAALAGRGLDNAMAESFFATLKAELVDRRHWPARAAARTAFFEWIEVFYNRQRSHSALIYRPSVAFEGVLLLSCPAA